VPLLEVGEEWTEGEVEEAEEEEVSDYANQITITTGQGLPC
jgi:hypothetical protein